MNQFAPRQIVSTNTQHESEEFIITKISKKKMPPREQQSNGTPSFGQCKAYPPAAPLTPTTQAGTSAATSRQVTPTSDTKPIFFQPQVAPPQQHSRWGTSYREFNVPLSKASPPSGKLNMVEQIIKSQGKMAAQRKQYGIDHQLGITDDELLTSGCSLGQEDKKN
jgi:hypothetical protein